MGTSEQYPVYKFKFKDIHVVYVDAFTIWCKENCEDAFWIKNHRTATMMEETSYIEVVLVSKEDAMAFKLKWKQMAEYIPYKVVSNGGEVSPSEYGYHIIPLYNLHTVKSLLYDLHAIKPEIKKWIENNIDNKWSAFEFTQGVSYCFYEEEDAMAFKLAWA